MHGVDNLKERKKLYIGIPYFEMKVQMREMMDDIFIARQGN